MYINQTPKLLLNLQLKLELTSLNCEACGSLPRSGATNNADDSLPIFVCSLSRWPSGLRRGSAADGLLGLWVCIPPGAWMFVLCVVEDIKVHGG